MSVKQRLVAYIEYKGISKIKFCQTIGVSNAFISSMVKSIQPDKVESITLNYPDLNMGWLMTGEGEMLKGEPLCKEPTKEDRLLSIIESQQRTIESLTKK